MTIAWMNEFKWYANDHQDERDRVCVAVKFNFNYMYLNWGSHRDACALECEYIDNKYEFQNERDERTVRRGQRGKRGERERKKSTK